MLTGTRVDDDAVLAGSLHAHVRARWIYARTGPTHTCTGPTHACSHQVPTPARSQGPSRTLAPGPLARLVFMHACTGSPCPLARGVPTHARTHRAMHARSHRAMHACSHRAPTPTRFPCTHAPGPARMLAPGPHARSHAGSPCMRAPGLCTHARTGPPCLLACGVPMCAGSLHSCMLHPMLYVLVVICSSSTVVF